MRLETTLPEIEADEGDLSIRLTFLIPDPVSIRTVPRTIRIVRAKNFPQRDERGSFRHRRGAGFILNFSTEQTLLLRIRFIRQANHLPFACYRS